MGRAAAIRDTLAKPGTSVTGREPAQKKEVRPPSPVEAAIVPGEFIVGAAMEPDAVLRALKPARFGLTCTVAATVEGVLHRVVCLRGEKELTETETRLLLEQWGRPEGVDFIELNGISRAMRVPDDTLYTAQWHYAAMSLPDAWDVSVGRPEVIVAVLDTGIGAHPDLDANVLPGIDLISDVANAADGDGWDDDPEDVMGDVDPRAGGTDWHGTHVAGTIAAQSNNARGVAGVAWNARVLPVRVLGKRGGTTYDIAAGLSWATGGAVSNTRRNTTVAKVVNMSLGGEGPPSQAYQTVIDAAVGRGAIIVVAAGNEDTNTANSRPCNQQNVICVGATDLRGIATRYTNYGSEVTISAPGGATDRDDDGDGYPDGVLSTVGGGRYRRLQGTSMATPHIAGLVALMRSVSPLVTLAEVRAALVASARPIPNCQAACGAGVVDAFDALRRIQPSTAPAPPSLSLNVTALTVTREEPRQTVRLSNRGGSTAAVRFYGQGPHIHSVYWNQDEEVMLEAGQSIDIVVSFVDAITRDLDIPLSFAAPESSVEFTLRVRAPRPQPLTVVLLMYQDGDEWEVADSVRAEDNGDYFFPAAPAGEYYLVAVSDDDGDGTFEEHEGFGMWPSVQDPRTLVLSPGRSYVLYDFSVAPSGS